MHDSNTSWGDYALWLIASHTEWIERRQETIFLRDDGETRRQISFDFTLPPGRKIPLKALSGSERSNDVEGTALDEESVVVPLCFMQKGTLVDLDVRDSDGGALPVLTMQENGSLVLEAMIALARKSGIELENEGIKSGLRHVIFDTRGRDASCIADVFRHTADCVTAAETDKQDPKKVECLNEKEKVKCLNEKLRAIDQEDQRHSGGMLAALLAAMAGNYVFAVAVPPEYLGRRSIIKVRYSSTASLLSAHGLGGASNLLGYQDLELVVATEAAKSTHVEIHTNSTLAITRLRDCEGSGEPKVVTTANRVHISFRPRGGVVKHRLLLRMAPVRAGLVTYLWALCCVNVQAVGLFVLAPQMIPHSTQGEPADPGFDPERLLVFRDANAITIVTLLLSVVVTLAVISRAHDVQQRVSMGPRLASVFAVLSFSLAILYLSAEAHVNRAMSLAEAPRVGILGIALTILLWAWVIRRQSASRPDDSPGPFKKEPSHRTDAGELPLGGLAATESALFDGLKPATVKCLQKRVLQGFGK